MKNVLFIVLLVCVGCDNVVIPKEAESHAIAPTADLTAVAPPISESVSSPPAPEPDGSQLTVTVEHVGSSSPADIMQIQCKSGFEMQTSVDDGTARIEHMPEERCRVFFKSKGTRTVHGELIGGGEWICTLLTADAKCRPMR